MAQVRSSPNKWDKQKPIVQSDKRAGPNSKRNLFDCSVDVMLAIVQHLTDYAASDCNFSLCMSLRILMFASNRLNISLLWIAEHQIKSVFLLWSIVVH